MATIENALQQTAAAQSSQKQQKTPPSGIRFDWIATLFFGLIIGGIYIDGWAHAHGKVDNTFFTPWHAILYGGLAASALFLVTTLVLNHRKGYAWHEALPAGYGYSLLGGIVFGIGGVLDMIWHILFGFEVNVEALLSPTHIILAFGSILIVTGPLRAAWLRFPKAQTIRKSSLFPAVLVVAYLLSIFGFFTEYAHPQVNTWAAKDAHTQASLPNDIYLMNADGSNQTRLISSSLDHSDIAISHDGRKIAFAAGQGNNTQIYVASIDGSGQVRLANNAFSEWAPAWSPDDSQIAFTSNRQGDTNLLYIMNADGSNQRRLTSASAMKAVWSPDGSKIAFISERDGHDEVYAMNADGSRQTRLTHLNANTWGPSWSPDSKKLVFSSDVAGKSAIYGMNANGSGLKLLTDPNASGNNWAPAWSPDGTKIAFASDRDGNSEVYMMNADGSHQVNISNNPGLENGDGGIVWTPDGSKLVYTAQAHQVVDSYTRSAIGIASILLQAALLMGVALLLLRRWALPLGSFTLILSISSALISVFNDQYILIPAAIAAGILIDLIVWWLKPTLERPFEFRIAAFVIPIIFYSLYFLTLFLTKGIDWSIHLWMGSIVLSGVVGLLLSYLVLPPLSIDNVTN